MLCSLTISMLVLGMISSFVNISAMNVCLLPNFSFDYAKMSWYNVARFLLAFDANGLNYPST